MSKIGNFLKHEGKVYIYCADRETGERFLKDAQGEGFLFSDGAKPTERHSSDIFALNGDRTINYVGFAGRVAFQCANSVSGRRLVRVDYGKYLEGHNGFIM